MDIWIHCGLHKTGTSAAQSILTRYKRQLLECDIYYPSLGADHHHKLAQTLIGGSSDWIRELYIHAMNNVGHNSKVLLSSEEFELLLINKRLFSHFHESLRHAGFSSVHYILAIRPQFEYFQSLYTQLSNTNVINYIEMAREILLTGEYRASSYGYSWRFVFDYARDISPLLLSHPENIHVMSMGDMVTIYPGFKILQLISGSEVLPQNIYSDIKKDGYSTVINTRPEDYVVESNYTRLFLLSTQDAADGVDASELSNEIIKFRLRQIKSFSDKIRHAFEKRFRSPFDSILMGTSKKPNRA